VQVGQPLARGQRRRADPLIAVDHVGDGHTDLDAHGIARGVERAVSDERRAGRRDSARVKPTEEAGEACVSRLPELGFARDASRDGDVGLDVAVLDARELLALGHRP
jgi:hypothetical protein